MVSHQKKFRVFYYFFFAAFFAAGFLVTGLFATDFFATAITSPPPATFRYLTD